MRKEHALAEYVEWIVHGLEKQGLDVRFVHTPHAHTCCLMLCGIGKELCDTPIILVHDDGEVRLIYEEALRMDESDELYMLRAINQVNRMYAAPVCGIFSLNDSKHLMFEGSFAAQSFSRVSAKRIVERVRGAIGYLQGALLQLFDGSGMERQPVSDDMPLYARRMGWMFEENQ